MKTTIDLPDKVLHRVKVIAAERKTTLKALVVQGLIHVTQSNAEEKKGARQKAMQRLISDLRGKNASPLTPLKRAEIYDR